MFVYEKDIAQLKEIPWSQLVTHMRKQVEETSRHLASRKRGEEQRVDKKIAMLRLALTSRIHELKKTEIDSDVLLELFNLLQRLQELIDQYEQDVGEWLKFLDLLEQKLEKEGLLEDEEQAHRMRSALEKLRAKLEEKK